MHPLLQSLSGGDRRSIGEANRVAAIVLAQPDLLETLFVGALARPVRSSGQAGAALWLAAIFATCASECVRGLRAKGIIVSTFRYSTLKIWVMKCKNPARGRILN